MSDSTQLAHQVRSLRDAKPFRPFSIVLNDGGRWPVVDSLRVSFTKYLICVIDPREHINRGFWKDVVAIEQH